MINKVRFLKGKGKLLSTSLFMRYISSIACINRLMFDKKCKNVCCNPKWKFHRFSNLLPSSE